MKDYSNYVTSTGNGQYQSFIKNNASTADFVRIIIGYTEMRDGKKVAWISDRWILSSISIGDEPIFIQSINKHTMNGRRMWVTLQSMKRHKHQSIPLQMYVATSPPVSKWRTKIGASAQFVLKTVSTQKDLYSYYEIPQLVYADI
ncbi:MAG: hypothetical protein ACOH18_00040 [Candidatus Saccharimonadaceae bacterium]